MDKKAKLLIDIILDETSNVSERDDAAMDMGDFDDPKVIEVLLQKGSDPVEDETVLNSCGESLAEIWVRQDFFDEMGYSSLHPVAKQGALFVIESRKPHWINKITS